ncbi:unnamed protein product [Chrysoparadoxa australica]
MRRFTKYAVVGTWLISIALAMADDAERMPLRLLSSTLPPTQNPLDVMVDPASLKLFVNGTEYYIKGVAYNPVPVGYQYVDKPGTGKMVDDIPAGYGGLCKSMISPEKTDDGDVSLVSACYDSDFAKSLSGGPWPNGDWFGDLWRRDFPLMEEMGINSVRFYNINPKNLLSCKQTPGWCDERGYIPDHRPMFKEAARHGLTVLWPLPTATEEAISCLSPDDIDADIDLSNVSIPDQLDSPACKKHWHILKGMIDEVVHEPNLLMWCYGNEDIPSAKLADKLTAEPTVEGEFRLNMQNEFIWRIRNYTTSHHNRRVPVTHATFGSPGIPTMNMMKYMDVDVFGSNPYGGAVLANNRPIPGDDDMPKKNWPHLPGLPKEHQPDGPAMWPGQVYLNWYLNKPTLATEWGNQPPMKGTLCLEEGKQGCQDGCTPEGDTPTELGLDECQASAFLNYGWQWGPNTLVNPSDAAWVSVFWKGMLEFSRMGGLIGGYFFEWTDELYSKRDDWSQRGLGLYHPEASFDECQDGSTDGSAAGGWGADKLTLTRAGEVALNGYTENGYNLSSYSFRADPFALMGYEPLKLQGQEPLPPTMGDGSESTSAELREKSWGVPRACFDEEVQATCLSRKAVASSATLKAMDDICEKPKGFFSWLLFRGPKADCSAISSTGPLYECTMLQKATHVFTALHRKTGQCNPAVAIECSSPPCQSAILSSSLGECRQPVSFEPEEWELEPRAASSPILLYASLGAGLLAILLLAVQAFLSHRRKRESDPERLPLKLVV